MMKTAVEENKLDQETEGTRRDFIYVATGMMGTFGLAATAWPFIDQMNPAADVLSLASAEIDVSSIELGQRVTVTWRGQPVFIDRRRPETISEMQAVDVSQLKDSQTDEMRVKQDEWLVVVGVCTHLGCVPLGQGDGDNRGEWGGWFCPCHGSHYDQSGRIMKGPAPKNLVVPPYEFKSDTLLAIG